MLKIRRGINQQEFKIVALHFIIFCYLDNLHTLENANHVSETQLYNLAYKGF